MRLGLAASTVTPGSTAPDASLTVPVIVACANAAEGTRTSTARTTLAARILRISLLDRCDPAWFFWAVGSYGAAEAGRTQISIKGLMRRIDARRVRRVSGSA